jgi:hypothetical protein
MKGIYYGSGYEVLGPYHPDEVRARAAAQALLRGKGQQMYEIKATSYEDARRKLQGAK